MPETCRGIECLKELISRFDGVKVGLPLLLKEGPGFLRKVAEEVEGYPILRIADFKLADIGDVMVSSLEAIKTLGYDAAIAHAFTGKRGGLETLLSKARELGVKVILVVSMSHDGSKEFYDKHFGEFLELAKELGAWGVVVPATRPQLISEARSALSGKIRILSPGVGVQGAGFGSALCSGADYEIVGRSVLRSSNPIETAESIIEKMKEVVRSCRMSSA